MPAAEQPSVSGTVSAPGGTGSGKGSEMGKWLALAAAFLGWMFDGAEMGLFSLVGRAAITDMLRAGGTSAPDEGHVSFLFNVVIAMFLVGAATGGVVFGWLGDRIGRVRAMSLSVITYALFTGLCGFAKTPEQIATLRFIAALGMGGEWSLGVSLVMEVWPNKSRALMAGLIGAAANFGYFFVGLVGLGLLSVLEECRQLLTVLGCSPETVTSLAGDQYKGWRLMMLLGTTPALLTFFFRLFVPESEKWQHEKSHGKTNHWATVDLLGVLVGALGPALIVYVWAAPDLPMPVLVRGGGTVLGLLIATAGYTYPVVQYLKRGALADQQAQNHSLQNDWRPVIKKMLLGAGLSGIALLGTWGSTQQAASWSAQLTGAKQLSGLEADSVLVKGCREFTLMASSLGAIFGTMAAAYIGDWLGRRWTYSLFCILSLVTTVAFYQLNTTYSVQFLVMVFVASTCTASFYGWLPLYLPELFATRIRATGQGFSFNFGRIIAAIGALQGGLLAKAESMTIFGYTSPRGYPLSCSVVSLIYLLGVVLICFAPETKGQSLPD